VFNQNGVIVNTHSNTKQMSLADLVPHPLQCEFYANCSADDDQALAEDLRQRGQQVPIIVMPDGNAAGLPPSTILDGHRRARLMLANGQTKAMVQIRHDLKDADAATVEAEFLKYNFTRRQLHPLDRARIAQRLFLLERRRKTVRSLSSTEMPAMRDRVGQALGMSGRNLDRYLRVLETPLPVQNAVRDRRMKLILGAKIALLPRTEQEEIASEIASITDPKQITEIVSRYLKLPDDRRHRKANDAAHSIAVALERGIEDLDGRVDQVGTSVIREKLDTFRKAYSVIAQLLKKVEPDRLVG
jgi:ParB-like chromosome segregation protein Spo0J